MDAEKLAQQQRAAVDSMVTSALDVTDIKVDVAGGFVYFTATKRGAIEIPKPVVVRLPYQQFLQMNSASVTNVLSRAIAEEATKSAIRGG